MEEPVSIVPNPDVIEPELRAPVVTMFEPPTLWLAKYVDTVSTFVIRIVPSSLIKIPSPEATAVVPLEVPPSIKLISTAVASIAANFVKSDWTNPETPSNRLSSAAVEVISVPPIEYDAAFTFLKPVMSLSESTITALLAETVPRVTPSKTVSSDEAKLVSPIIRVEPLKCKSFQVLSEEPKL